MTEQQACTLCGAGGHTAAQCNWAKGEHEKFEAWVLRERPGSPLQYVRDALPVDDPRYGEYCDPTLQCALDGWMARAALAQPSTAPELDDQAFDRNAERLTAEAFGTGGGINPNATSIDDLFLDDVSAPELERPEALARLVVAKYPHKETRRAIFLCEANADDQGAEWCCDDGVVTISPLIDRAFVAQHDRIVGALLRQKHEADTALAWATRHYQSVEQQRDAAQARVAELSRETLALCDAVENKGDLPPVKFALRAGRAVNIVRDLIARADYAPHAGQVPEGWRVMRCTSSVQREGDKWEIYDPQGSGGVVSTHDVKDWAVRGLLDALSAAQAKGE